jgi:hypothetical protein
MAEQSQKRFAVGTLDDKRTYAADVDMKGDAAELAKKKSLDAERTGNAREGDEGLAAVAGQTGQT